MVLTNRRVAFVASMTIALAICGAGSNVTAQPGLLIGDPLVGEYELDRDRLVSEMLEAEITVLEAAQQELNENLEFGEALLGALTDVPPDEQAESHHEKEARADLEQYRAEREPELRAALAPLQVSLGLRRDWTDQMVVADREGKLTISRGGWKRGEDGTVVNTVTWPAKEIVTAIQGR